MHTGSTRCQATSRAWPSGSVGPLMEEMPAIGNQSSQTTNTTMKMRPSQKPGMALSVRPPVVIDAVERPAATHRGDAAQERRPAPPTS